MKKPANLLTQIAIFSGVLLVSSFIAKFSPIPIPSSVIGIVLLFLALNTGLIKLEQVESLGERLISYMSFLFVPSSISLITSLDIIKGSVGKILGLILFWTLVAMVAIVVIGEVIEKVKAASKKRATAKAATSHKTAN